MKFFQLQENTKSYAGLATKASANSDSEVGTTIDLHTLNDPKSCLVICEVGAATGTPDSFSVVFSIEDSANDSSFAALTTAVTTTMTAAGIAELYFDPRVCRRYVHVKRVVTIVNGTSPKVPTSAAVVMGCVKRGPLS